MSLCTSAKIVCVNMHDHMTPFVLHKKTQECITLSLGNSLWYAELKKLKSAADYIQVIEGISGVPPDWVPQIAQQCVEGPSSPQGRRYTTQAMPPCFVQSCSTMQPALPSFSLVVYCLALSCLALPRPVLPCPSPHSLFSFSLDSQGPFNSPYPADCALQTLALLLLSAPGCPTMSLLRCQPLDVTAFGIMALQCVLWASIVCA